MAWIFNSIIQVLKAPETLYIVSIFAVVIVLTIISIASNWAILRKAGMPGWVAIVPLVNICAEYEICWYKELGVLYNVLAFIYSVTAMNAEDQILGGQAEIAGFVLLFIMAVLEAVKCYKISKAFGHGLGFAVGLALLPMIFDPILGFGKSKYIGKQ